MSKTILVIIITIGLLAKISLQQEPPKDNSGNFESFEGSLDSNHKLTHD